MASSLFQRLTWFLKSKYEDFFTWIAIPENADLLFFCVFACMLFGYAMWSICN